MNSLNYLNSYNIGFGWSWMRENEKEDEKRGREKERGNKQNVKCKFYSAWKTIILPDDNYF